MKLLISLRTGLNQLILDKRGVGMSSKLKKQEKRKAVLAERAAAKAEHEQKEVPAIKAKILEVQKKLRKAIATGNKANITRYTNQIKKLREQI